MRTARVVIVSDDVQTDLARSLVNNDVSSMTVSYEDSLGKPEILERAEGIIFCLHDKPSLTDNITALSDVLLARSTPGMWTSTMAMAYCSSPALQTKLLFETIQLARLSAQLDMIWQGEEINPIRLCNQHGNRCKDDIVLYAQKLVTLLNCWQQDSRQFA